MNTRTFLALVVLVAIIAPAIAPLIHTAAAATEVKVSAQYLNYNILKVTIPAARDANPVVLVTVKDWDGNVIISDLPVLTAYVSYNKWVAYIALNKTFDKGVFSGLKVANFTNTTTPPREPYEIPGEETVYADVSGLAKITTYTPKFVYFFEGKPVLVGGVGLANGNVVSPEDVWPIVTALNFDYSRAAEIEITVLIGDQKIGPITVQLGPSPMEQVSPVGTYNFAPEKPVCVNVTDETVTLVNPDNPSAPVVGNLSYNTPAQVTTSNVSNTTIRYTSGLNITETLTDNSAVKALLLEASGDNATYASLDATISLKAEYEVVNGMAGNTTVTLTVQLDKNLPQYTTLFAVVKFNTSSGYVLTAAAAIPGGSNNTTVSRVYEGAFSISHILSYEIIVLPANYSFTINGQSMNLAYLPVTSATLKGKNLELCITMVGRDYTPSYNDIESTARSGAVVVVQLTESSSENVELYANEVPSYTVATFQGEVALEVGELSITTASVKIGGELTIHLKDIDAYEPTVAIYVCNADCTVIKPAGIVALEAVGASEFEATLAVKLSYNGSTWLDARHGVLHVVPGDAVIVAVYKDKYPTVLSRKAYAGIEPNAVEVSAPASAAITQTISLNITSANFNMNAEASEALKLSIASDGTIMVYYVGTHTAAAGTHVANITFKFNGEPLINVTGLSGIQRLIHGIAFLLEKSANSGSYVLPIDLSVLNKSGVLTIVYTDLLTGEEKTIDVRVGVTTGTVYFKVGRTKVETLPIAVVWGLGDISTANNTVVFRVYVDDSDANRNPDNYDTVPVTLRLITATGHTYEFTPTLTLGETDVDTGVFARSIAIVYWANKNGYWASFYYISGGSLIPLNLTENGKNIGNTISVGQLVGAYIEAQYDDASTGETVRARLLFAKPATAEITVEPSTITDITGNVTITIREPDLNIVPGAENDELPASVMQIRIFGPDNKHVDKRLADLFPPDKYVFEEVEPGVFKLTLPAYEFVDILAKALGDDYNYDNTTNMYDLIGAKVTISYYDPVSAMSAPGSAEADVTKATVSIVAHKAEVVVAPEKVSPYGIITINVSDADLVKIPGFVQPNVQITNSTKRCVDCIRLMRLVSSGIEFKLHGNDVEVVLPDGSSFTVYGAVKTVEYPDKPGLYTITIDLYKIYSHPVGRYETLAQYIVYALQQPVTDKLLIVYVDGETPEGPVAITKFVEVVAETGKIEVPEAVKEGSTVTIKVVDFDQNRDPQAYDYATVRIIDAIGQSYTIRLVETEPDSGVFTGDIVLVDNVAESGGNKVYAKAGDVLKVYYADPINASGLPQTISAEIKVVKTPPVKYPAEVAKEAVKLETVMGFKAVAVNVTNTAESDITGYVVVVFYDETGAIVGLAIGGPATIPAKSSAAVYALVPAYLKPGTYKVQVMVFKDLVSLEPLLKQPVETTVTIQ